MVLADLKTALLTVTQKVYHADASGATGNYIVWAEDGASETLWADNQMKNQALTGTIDYFTTTEYDPIFGTIQTALNTLGISYSLNSIQFEEDTRYFHYEWVWEMI